MKLAEALILRADCQKRIAQLKSRLLTNAKVQEGDKPAETPQDLLTELGRVSTELLDLIKRINKTNSATAFAGRGTISDALADRADLKLTGAQALACNSRSRVRPEQARTLALQSTQSVAGKKKKRAYTRQLGKSWIACHALWSMRGAASWVRIPNDKSGPAMSQA